MTINVENVIKLAKQYMLEVNENFTLRQRTD